MTIINTDNYTACEAFASYAGDGETPGIIRLTPVSGSAQPVEASLTAADRRAKLTLPITPGEQYELHCEGLELGFAYLTGGENLIDRGIRIITSDTRATAHRPRAHFEPAQHWMNDPNGLCRFQGRYHMFYQYNPYGWEWDSMHWGHAVSHDLMHWVDLPIALLPQPDLSRDGSLAGGAFSGSAVTVDESGRIVPGDQASAIRIFLTRHWERRGDPRSVIEEQTTAVSTDGLTFGTETTVIRRPGDDFGPDFRDPKADDTLLTDAPDGETNSSTTTAGVPTIVVATNLPAEQAPAAGEIGSAPRPSGTYWYGESTTAAAGEQTPDLSRIPTLALFRATDSNLDNATWEYAGPLLFETGLPEAYTYECPDTFSVDGSAVAIGSVMKLHDTTGRFQPIRWYTGSVVEPAGSPRFDVEQAGWCDFGSCYYAVQSFRDRHTAADGSQSDRRIAIGWLCDWFGVRIERNDYANGVMSLPRELHVVDGRLHSRPIQEVYDLLIGGELTPDATDGTDSGRELRVNVPNHAYYANIIPEANQSFTMTLVSGLRKQSDGTMTQASLKLASDGKAVHLTTTGLPTDGCDYVSVTEQVNRVEVFYDHGVAEVFVNNGEDVGAVLFDCSTVNDPVFVTAPTVTGLHGAGTGTVTFRELRSTR
ncbi:glycoside hydrolase family 32 protein [Bifidobacterium scaligerum]|uniref:beta-fructofuranosidase n=1 Tax=Bifidobacterium scaligerum TaxID=2052656 RepID=A0A2M9HNY6_9BIFI|nr:glycoside hydrolase family 32 protein [Bifidobacterium scaligerum]PJM78517.1 beta-fructofuranosidase [Bifidobacterium scaligerum]